MTLGVYDHEKQFRDNEKIIPRAAALLCTLVIGLLVAGVFYRRNKSEIDVFLLTPAAPHSQSSDRMRLSLCDLNVNALAYRGKEVVIEASHISRLSSQRFSVLRKCGPQTISAKITLVNENNFPESLLIQLSELMYRRRESIDAAADKVIVTGVVERLDARVQNFDLVASAVEVVVAPADSKLTTHNKRFRRTRTPRRESSPPAIQPGESLDLVLTNERYVLPNKQQ